MRWLAAAMAISVAAFGLPAQASDELSPFAAGLAPLDDAMLAMMTGGAAAALELGANAEAGAQSVDLTATSSLQASISHSSCHLAGVLKTGDISLCDGSGAMGVRPPSSFPPALTISSRTAPPWPSLSKPFAVTGVTRCSDRAGPLD